MSVLSKSQLAATEPWIRTKSDEAAIDEGCFWDLESAAYTVWWIERYCRLYEGVWAGSPVVLYSCADQPEFDIPDEFYGDDGEVIPSVLDFYRQRVEWHLGLRDAGHHMDWQFEVVCEVFGWQQPTERWKKFGIDFVRRFTRAGVFVPKKSKKTPSCAAISLYLTCGENIENANKTFLGCA